jgi:O-methyltransferase
MDLPGGVVTGPAQWDLRATVDRYLGGVDFRGKRVLEIGPASGFLSFHMERAGAEVVCIEPPIDAAWDFIPRGGVFDAAGYRRGFTKHMTRIRNGFWFAHAAYGSKVQVWETGAYHLPSELGRFDIAIMAAILVHCASPVGIMAACASVADTLIITDRVSSHKAPLAQLMPSADNGNNDTWWEFSPTFSPEFTRLMGFHQQTITHAEHRCSYLDQGLSMMTLVARR